MADIANIRSGWVLQLVQTGRTTTSLSFNLQLYCKSGYSLYIGTRECWIHGQQGWSNSISNDGNGAKTFHLMSATVTGLSPNTTYTIGGSFYMNATLSNVYYGWMEGSANFTTEALPTYWNDVNVLNPDGVQDYASGYFDLYTSENNSKRYDLTNEDGDMTHSQGTYFEVSNIRPYYGHYVLNYVTGHDSEPVSGTYRKIFDAANEVMTIQMKYRTYYRDINAWQPGNSAQNGLVFDYYIYDRGGNLVNSYPNSTNEVANTVTREYGYTGKINNIRPNITGAHYTTNNVTGNGAGEFTWTYNNENAIELYSAWNTYTVRYNANGGRGSMADTGATYNTAFNLRSNAFVKTGYTFLGWSTSSSATSATYSNGQSVNNLTTTHGGVVTLYAVWRMDALPSVSLSVNDIKPTSVTVTPTASGTLSYVKNLSVYYADMPIKVLSDGSVWTRVYYHDSQAGTVLWTSASEAKNTQTANKYSRMDLLGNNYFKGSDGKLELMLTYPTDFPNNYNRWKQTNNPCAIYTGTGEGTKVPGYEAIKVDWTGDSWGGLERNSSDANAINYTYVDGSVGFGNWWYAIAPANYYEGGMPGPSKVVYRQCELWARIPNAIGYTKSVSANSAVTLSEIEDETDWYFCTQTTNSIGVAYSSTQKATTPVDQAQARIKQNNTWHYGKTFIKNNGVWKKAKKIYIKQNGVWKLGKNK